MLPWCSVSVTTLDARRVGFVRLLERGPGRLALFSIVGRRRCLRRLAVGESSTYFLVCRKLCFSPWGRSGPPWRSCLRLGLSAGLRIPRLLLLLLLLRLVPVLSIVHVLPGFECILTLGCGISTLRCRCWAREVGEAIRAGALRSLICAGLCPSGRRRVCRSRCIRVASGTTTAACSSASITCWVQASLASVSIIARLFGRLAQNLVRGLDGLELGYVFFLFAGVAVGVVLQSEPAVLFLHFFAARGGWQVEVGI